MKIFLKLVPRRLKEFLKKSKFFRDAFVFLFEKRYKPEWIKIKNGILSNRYIFLDKKSGLITMSDGTHDSEQIEFIKKLNLKNKVIFDIGAHIGYMSMCFAELVGENGKVLSFEPNKHNVERFKKNLEKNKDLEKIIKIYNCALTDKNGVEKFIFNKNIDGGTSSGSFLDKADTALDRKFYSLFEEKNVETLNLNEFKDAKPDFIKIDIEGYEGELIKNNLSYFKKNLPKMVIEIHSILNMYIVTKELISIGYKIEIIKKESDGRCDIWCEIQ